MSIIKMNLTQDLAVIGGFFEFLSTFATLSWLFRFEIKLDVFYKLQEVTL